MNRPVSGNEQCPWGHRSDLVAHNCSRACYGDLAFDSFRDDETTELCVAKDSPVWEQNGLAIT